MPRKRVTQLGTRKKPKAPSGSEGNDLTVEEKKDKLEFFKKDFQTRVEKHLETMEKEKEEMLEYIDFIFQKKLAQIPKPVRDMKMCDFMAAGGIVELALASLECSAGIAMPPPDSAKSSHLRSRTRAVTLNEIPEEPSESEPENRGERMVLRQRVAMERRSRGFQIKTGRMGGRRTQRGKVAFKDASNMPPPSCRSTRYRTPANRALASVGMVTPIITPKFDPRWPVTPGLGRRPQPGEQLLSMAGSPILNPVTQDDIGIGRHRSTIRKQGRTLTVNLDLEQSTDDLDLEGVTQADLDQMLAIFHSISRARK